MSAPNQEPRGSPFPPMRVLAIDTALEACSVAVLDTEESARARSRSLPMVRGHAEALMPLIANVMSEARTEFAELDRIAVTVGPGSFTGLRVGVAAARGIGLAAGKAGGRAHHALGARRAADRCRRQPGGARRHRCAARQRLHAVVRTGRPHPGRAARRAAARCDPRRDGEPDADRRQCRPARRSGMAGQRAPAARS